MGKQFLVQVTQLDKINRFRLEMVGFNYIDPRIIRELTDLLSSLYLSMILPNMTIAIYAKADRREPFQIDTNTVRIFSGGKNFQEVKEMLSKAMEGLQEEGKKRKIRWYKNQLVMVNKDPKGKRYISYFHIRGSKKPF